MLQRVYNTLMLLQKADMDSFLRKINSVYHHNI